MNTYDEWYEFLQRPGSIATMPPSALNKPCPKCKQHQGYEVTQDCWAYCRACHWGTPTELPFTRSDRVLEVRKPDGTVDEAEMIRIWGKI